MIKARPTAYFTFLPRWYYIVAKEMNRPVSENGGPLGFGFDVSLISPISGIEQFPQTHGKSDIISGLSSQPDALLPVNDHPSAVNGTRADRERS